MGARLKTTGEMGMDTIKVGVIGYGIMGKTYADAIRTFEGAEVAAVSDVNQARRKKAAEAYDCRVYAPFHDMFHRESLDAVIVAVPDFLHREPVVAAAKAGLAILMEKPFATSMEDARAMMAAIRASNVICSIEFGNRWSPPFILARQRIQNGELGDVLAVSADLNDTLFVPTEMLSWAAKSTPAWFLMSHTADLVAWITGKKPVRVFATGTKKLLVSLGIATYDHIEALVEYDDGTTGRFTNGWVLPRAMPLIYEFRMRFMGSKGAIDLDMTDQGMHVVTHETYEHPHTVSGCMLGRYVGSLFHMLRDFLEAVREKRPPMVEARDGYENTRFLVAVHQSLSTGRPVKMRVGPVQRRPGALRRRGGVS
jgi:predicted dehydrogenase